MSFNYTNYLGQQLNILKHQLELDDYNIVIGDEQIFERHKDPNTFYIVVKHLSVGYSLNSKTQPLQISVISEDNSCDKAKLLFDTFTENYNWNVVVQDGTFVKQQYQSPVVVSNYQEISYGFTSLLFISANLFIMENVADVDNLTINGVSVKPLSFNFSYNMSGNTQQIPTNYIASTIKSIATVTVSITLPLLTNYATTTPSYNLIDDILDISRGYKTGNTDFAFVFSIHSKSFSYTMKLTTAQIATAPDQIPTIQLGFMV